MSLSDKTKPDKIKSANPSQHANFAGVFTRNAIEAQQQSLAKVSRFPFMKFEPDLEAAFEDFRYKRLIKRVPIIGITGLVLFCAFSILDVYSLPEAVFEVSIPLRLFLIIPLIGLVIYLAKRGVSAKLFIPVYFGVYLIAGVAISIIIYTAAMNDYFLPYDGILLHLVFGYFLMGLPYMLAMYGGLLISAVYLFMSAYMHLPFEQLASNSLFIICINFVGTVGCYLQERARRFLFLNENLVLLSKAKDKKEIASKTRLVATASHDLRQPLHAMHLLIETLDDQLPEGEHKGIVKSLDISIKQLSHLLNTLLDISKLNAGIVEPKLESINLPERISGFCQEQALRLEESNISMALQGKDKVFVRVDPYLFDRMIRNVMENIYVHAGATHISMSWTCDQDSARLEIRDNGKGIADADLTTIFEEFQQFGDSAKSGMGLGLTIVKQLAELQHINYGLDSALGKGSCFWFTLALVAHQEKPLSTSFVNITVIKKVTSTYAQTWAEKIKAWGYTVNLLPLGLNMTPEHIKRVLTRHSQILIWDACEATDIHNVFETLQALQANVAFTLAFVIVSNATIQEYPLPENLNFQLVSPSIRAAKLRMIIEHLASEL